MQMDKSKDYELTILMPCLNEEETIVSCINKAHSFLKSNCISGEIIIADNGSIDNSKSLAIVNGAKVISVEQKGYGAALLGGIDIANGRYIIMGDADDSYDFSNLYLFIENLRQGADLVIGNRFKGGIKPKAMPFLHHYLGNPILSGIGRLFFNSNIGDFHCGLRGFNTESIRRIKLQASGMEFASEMIIKATFWKLKITEVPTTLSPDGRSRSPHLRSWRDGWRHLRLLLIFSPRWLFLYPGLFFILVGIVTMFWLIPGLKIVAGIGFDIHTMLYSAAAIIIGMQAVFFALFSNFFAERLQLFPSNKHIYRLMIIWTLEKGLIIGLLLVFLGVCGSIDIFSEWSKESFDPMYPQDGMRIVIPSVTSLIIGLQIIFGSFFMSILKLIHK